MNKGRSVLRGRFREYYGLSINDSIVESDK